jgi:hypothetical protein
MDIPLTTGAEAQLLALMEDPSKKIPFKAVSKCIRLLAVDPRHPGLSTHKWKARTCPHGRALFEAYAQNHTAGAYRVFFCYDAPQGGILIVSIGAHP